MQNFENGIYFIDGFKGKFQGINPIGIRWNGWHCPYFTLEVAKKVLKGQTSKKQCLDDGCYFYELTEDKSEILCITDEGEFIENSVEIDGIKYYAIGFYNWVWERKKID